MTVKEQIQDVLQDLVQHGYREIALDEMLKKPHLDRVKAVDKAIETVEFNEGQPTRYRNPNNPAILDSLTKLRHLLPLQNFDEKKAERREIKPPPTKQLSLF